MQHSGSHLKLVDVLLGMVVNYFLLLHHFPPTNFPLFWNDNFVLGYHPLHNLPTVPRFPDDCKGFHDTFVFVPEKIFLL